jgi:hypothetical protein
MITLLIFIIALSLFDSADYCFSILFISFQIISPFDFRYITLIFSPLLSPFSRHIFSILCHYFHYAFAFSVFSPFRAYIIAARCFLPSFFFSAIADISIIFSSFSSADFESASHY